MSNARTRWLLLWLTAAWACSGDDASNDDTDTEPTDGVTDYATTTDTEPTDSEPIDSGTPDTAASETGDTGSSTSGIVVDCAALPANPTSAQIVPNARAYHGLAFDTAGNLLGYANQSQSVVSFDYYGNFQVYSPNIGWPQQFDMAPSGNLYVAANDGVKEVLPNGSQVTIGSFSGAYGLKVGPDGKIYAADNSRLVRIDPATNQQEVVIPPGEWSPRVMDWSPDLTKLYFSELSGGRLFVVDLDVDYMPSAPPQVLANFPNTSYHDALMVDVCGNIYLAIYSDSAMYRITPSGVVSTLVDTSLTYYGHGAQFGSGIGGWREDALYVPQPYNNDTVAEMVIGVYHRSWTGGTVINAP